MHAYATRQLKTSITAGPAVVADRVPAGTGRAGTSAPSVRWSRCVVLAKNLSEGCARMVRFHDGRRQQGAWYGRAVAAHGRTRTSRRRVEQGRGDHGEVRRPGRRRARRDVYRRGAGQRAQPPLGPAGGLGAELPPAPAGEGTGPGGSPGNAS